MKKFLTTVLALILAATAVLSLSACKGEDKNTNENGNGNENNTTNNTPGNGENNTDNTVNTPSYSKGLEFELSDDGTYYIFTGLGTCTDTDLVIPAQHNNLPVKHFSFSGGGMSLLTSVTSIYIPESITQIYSQAFRDYDFVTTIDVDANNPNYKSIDGNLYTKDGKTLVQYATGKPDVSFNIPSGVEIIGDHAFYEGDNLKSCVIPNSVITIGDGAFASSEIESVIIGNGVKTIGDTAFYKCFRLSNLVMGNSVEFIGAVAFTDCKFTTISIPNTIKSIGGGNFEYCPITFNEYGNALYLGNDENPYLVLVKTASSSDYYYTPVDVTVPKDTKVIMSYNGIASFNVDADNKVFKSIDGTLYTKDEKTLLQYAIGKEATSFTVPEGVEIIGENSFAGCSLKSVTIGNNVTDICSRAFSNCKMLSNVTIGSGVTNIAAYAFSGCSALVSITIPATVEAIENGTFANCNSLKNIFVNENNPNYKSIDGNLYTKDGKTLVKYAMGKEELSFTIPSGVEKIGDAAFSPNAVVIDNNYVDTGYKDEFSNSTLERIIIPNSVTNIGIAAFASCNSLISISVPDSVKSLGSYAFYNCISLTDITLGEGIKTIGNYTFYECTGLTDIVLGKEVEAIGDSAFSSCYGLTDVVVSNSVKNIGDYAFAYCDGLTSITLGKSVETIGDCIFEGCNNLKNVMVDEGNATYKSIDGILYTKDVKTLIYYPKAKTATMVTIPSGVETIAERAFRYCESITSVVIPKSVKVIERSIFYYSPFSSNRMVVYYEGSQEDWAKIAIDEDDNNALKKATIHYNFVIEN